MHRTSLLIILALFCAHLQAQVVRLANYSTAPFTGWKRVTVDELPPHEAGRVGEVRYVLGRSTGLRTRALDLQVTLAPGEQRTLDLSTATAEPFQIAPLPANPLMHFGGPATLAGNGAALVSIEIDGAGYVVELVARAGRMLCGRWWVLYYPDQPHMATGEAVLVASNPAVTDLTETAPVDVHLGFGDALVWVPGAGIGGRLMRAGETFADGQGRAVPLLFVWLRHLRTGTEWSSIGAAADLGVCGVGVRQLLPDGNPLMPIGFSGRAWARQHWPRVVAELHTRARSLLGPNPTSNDSGEQEVQTSHVGGEAMVADGVGCELVRYLSAIRAHSSRPCNHLEADGRPLSIEQHPRLVMWDGRRHWHPNLSPDRLGKVADLTAAMASGWWGWDVQHGYIGDLAESTQLVATRGGQWLLERNATIYLLQRTATPGWSTTGFESAREWACEADMVERLHRCLTNRVLADRVVSRWRERVRTVLVPWMVGKQWIYPRENDPRVNPTGWGVQFWQEAFAAGAVWRTCRDLGPVEGLAPMERVARNVLATAWQQDPDRRYRAQPQGPIDGSPNAVNPATLSFNSYGMPMAVWCVLQVEPTNAKARAIWLQLMADPGEKARRWMLPL